MKNTLCLIVKDEAAYILEWIAYHRAIGFENFCIFDNESSDGTRQILVKLASQGVIDHWDQNSIQGSPQRIAYARCIQAYQGKTDLITFIDTDEFIAAPTGIDVNGHIAATFDRHPDMAAMALNWRIFGSSGHEKQAPGLVIERFRHAAKHPSRTVKTIVRPGNVATMYTHYASLNEGRYGDELGRPVQFEEPKGTPAPGNIARASASALQINHYMVKSQEEFSAKSLRGNANYPAHHPDKYKRFDDKYFTRYDINEVIDESAYTLVQKTKNEMQLLYSMLGVEA